MAASRPLLRTDRVVVEESHLTSPHPVSHTPSQSSSSTLLLSSEIWGLRSVPSRGRADSEEAGSEEQSVRYGTEPLRPRDSRWRGASLTAPVGLVCSYEPIGRAGRISIPKKEE